MVKSLYVRMEKKIDDGSDMCDQWKRLMKKRSF